MTHNYFGRLRRTSGVVGLAMIIHFRLRLTTPFLLVSYFGIASNSDERTVRPAVRRVWPTRHARTPVVPPRWDARGSQSREVPSAVRPDRRGRRVRRDERPRRCDRGVVAIPLEESEHRRGPVPGPVAEHDDLSEPKTTVVVVGRRR